MPAAEEEQESRADDEPDESGRSAEFQAFRRRAEEDVEALQQGSTVSLLGAEVPVRVLLALGIFLLVFMLVWIALWALGGTAGLALGWIPAAAAGLVAIRLVR